MALANVNAPRGFQLFQQGGKVGANREIRTAQAGRTGGKDLMIGDAYTIMTDGYIRRVTADTDPVHGIVEGIVFKQLSTTVLTESQDYIPSTSEGQVIGIEDRNAIFVVQIATVAQADIDGTAGGVEIVDADGNVLLRQSRQSVILGNENQFQLVALAPITAANSLGAFAKVLVRTLQAFAN